MDFVKQPRIDLKKNKKISEAMIQREIYNDPSILGLGNLTPITAEKTLPGGGRLDMVMMDDTNARYVIELQLGATDPQHIIRTIEYWDLERKHAPDYFHYAVIIAEKLNQRFHNVISLFNGAIPMIAIQVAAYQVTDTEVALIFTRIMDRVTSGESTENTELVTRQFWLEKSTPQTMKLIDELFLCITSNNKEYSLKYNKRYIGTLKNGAVDNFISFDATKKFVWLQTPGKPDSKHITNLENEGIVYSYENALRRFKIKIRKLEDYTKNKDIIDPIIAESKARRRAQ